MTEQTIQNIIFFTITFCESYNNNNGHVFPNYIDEKSRKYLGINLSEYTSISIKDFGIALTSDGYYNIRPPHEVLNNIKGKIDLSLLHDSDNLIYDGHNYFNGKPTYRVNGLDLGRQTLALVMLDSLGEDYFTKVARDYNIEMLLNGNEEVSS